MLFEKVTFHSKIINIIAGSTFAVYLITDYPYSRQMLWQHYFDLHEFFSFLGILQAIGLLVVIFFTCIILDFIRRMIFSISVDRHPAAWFDALWNAISRKIAASRRHPLLSSLRPLADENLEDKR